MATIRILANDGIHPAGKEMLENAGYEVVTDKIAQEDLPAQLPEFDVILVRSATKVRKELIDACPDLKIIGRGGVGLDNIDVEYAKDRDIQVFNTPAASSQSVAELVFAHAIGAARFLPQANRNMPVKGDSEFKTLKKAYGAGIELKGKTIGIVGFGRIGQAVGRIAVGMGMKVLAHDPYLDEATLRLDFYGSSQSIQVLVKTGTMRTVLEKSDIVTLHVPSQGRPVIGEKELKCMRPEAILINASRGGIIDEKALIAALDNGVIRAAGLDVFANEPTPSQALLSHPKISLSPHIGAATGQAQANIGTELAGKIIHFFGD
jgi:D-3-phosphoglycerate dehydrogenase / 2-oxoglutarate reductase